MSLTQLVIPPKVIVIPPQAGYAIYACQNCHPPACPGDLVYPPKTIYDHFGSIFNHFRSIYNHFRRIHNHFRMFHSLKIF